MVRRPLASALIALACVAVPLLACGKHKKTGPAGSSSSTSGSSASPTSFARNETLYVGGRQWGEPSSFNPLAGWQDWPVNSMNLIYETLLMYSPTEGKLVPLLAESWEVKDESVSFAINAAAKWNDGQPVTGEDVKFTFALGKQFASLLQSPLFTGGYVTDVTLSDPQHVVFALDSKKKNALPVLDAAVEIRIVPKHVIEPMLKAAKDNIDEFLKQKMDKEPVGSGPYKLLTYSSEKIVTQRDDKYWGNQVFFGGKLAAPKFVTHPIFKSNDHFSVGLQQGNVDTSASFLPRIQEKKNVKAWYDKPPYFLSASVPMLWPNVLQAPLDDVHLRRAMAFSINYTDIRELAVSGYSDPLESGLILPFDKLENKYFSAEDAKQFGASRYDVEAAKAELKAGGYTSVFKDGELVEMKDKSGKKVPTITIKSPTGWTDWESIVKIVVKSMRAAGIDAREKFVDASLFWGDLYTADFDLIMFTPTAPPSPSTPWRRFDVVLSGAEWAPKGEKRYKNLGRFNNPKGPGYIARIDELLNEIPRIKDEAELVKAYRELNLLYMKNQPTLPLVYRADQFYEFTEQVWKGFPTSANPFLPPQMPGDRLGTRILWSLTPAAGK
jgi:peptide/nickel transport system substrate-binding protein